MNRQSQYDRIRKLIADWYDGNTTLSDEKEIGTFFHSTDPQELPDDLRREALIFRTVDMISEECPDKELLAEIEAEATRERRTRRFRLRRRFIVAVTAAAASIALLIGFCLRPGNNTVVSVQGDLYASELKTPTEPVDSVSTSVAPEVETVQTVMPEQTVRPKTRPSVRKPSHRNEAIAQTTTDDAGYTHIDDPEEAMYIMVKARKQYSRAMAMTDKAFSETDNAFDNAENILRNTIEKS